MRSRGPDSIIGMGAEDGGMKMLVSVVHDVKCLSTLPLPEQSPCLSISLDV
jgi:hypothetical protein